MAKWRERLVDRGFDPDRIILVAGVALLIGIVLGIVLVINAVWAGYEWVKAEAQEAEAQEETIADQGRERALDYYAEGVTVLALEYGIRLDEREVRDLLDDKEFGREIGSGLAMGIIFWDWWDSPADKARTVKDAILEDGNVPSEVMQSFADRLAKRHSSDSP